MSLRRYNKTALTVMKIIMILIIVITRATKVIFTLIKTRS